MPFFLLPVLTRYLSPDDYGIVAMFLLLAVLVEPLIGFSLPGAVGVRYFEPDSDISRYLGTGVLVAALAASAAMIPLFVFRDQIEAVTRVPGTWVLLVIPLVFARTILNSCLSLLRTKELVFRYTVLQVGQVGILVALILLLVVYAQLGWQGRVTAEFLALAIAATGSAWWLTSRRDVAWQFVRAYASHLLAFGIPLIPHVIGGALIVQTDRLLLTNLVGLGQTGLYTVAAQLVLVIEIVAVSFNGAYSPWLFSNLTNADATTRRRLVRLTYIQFAAMATLALAVALLAPWLAATLLDPRYGAVSEYAGWLSLGFLFNSMYYMVTNYIFYARRTGWLAAVTLTTGLINIPITYVFIQARGGVGAAQATALAYGLGFVLTWIVSNRVYPMPWLEALRRRPDAR